MERKTKSQTKSWVPMCARTWVVETLQEDVSSTYNPLHDRKTVKTFNKGTRNCQRLTKKGESGKDRTSLDRNDNNHI